MKQLQIFYALILETTNWLYPLGLMLLAGILEAGLISGIFSAIKISVILAIFPFIYLLWLLIFLCLSAFGTTLLFRFGPKPRFIEIDIIHDLPLLIKFSPTIISYRLGMLLLGLPIISYLKLTPSLFKWLQFLAMRAYAPQVHIGKRCTIILWPQDPDLTYIGDNVVIGSGCEIVAHALNTSGTKVKYISEPIIIGNKSTIGGNTRIGMGVKIEEEAIIELGSNVLPYTRIGKGEVWGGNPAVFLRKANDANSLELNSIPQRMTSPELSDVVDIIAKAVHLPPEKITDNLSSENCMTWDSLAAMSIAAGLYDRFSIRVSAQDIFKLNSYQSVKQLINVIDTSDTVFIPNQETEIPGNPELLPLHDTAKVTQILASRFQESTPAYSKKLIIASSFTAQPINSTLELWCRAFGIPFAIEFGQFNQIEQILFSPDSIFLSNDNGLNIVLTRPEDLISDEDKDGRIRASQLLNAISSYAAKKKGLIVSNLPPVVSSFFNANYQEAEKLRQWWQQQLESIEGIHILDFAKVIENIGRQNAHDASFETIARAPYSQIAYQELAITITRLARAIFLPAKKVLALDCDGILWGGVVGEDGIDGIALSNDYPGRSFRLFQQMLLELKGRGILLVLVSKNEEADVWDVFDNHPEMMLKRSDIAAYRINWKEKSTNLSEVAKELNLSLDSFVFVDDSPIECSEVRANSNEVTVINMPKESALYVETLSKLWCFDSASITTEDRVRTELIAQEQQRRELQHNVTNLETYLESLQLVVEIRAAEETDLPRVAQLTQKTNQFNLSLIRRSLTEIQDIKKTSSILVLNLKDRFGNYGLVGAAIFIQENEYLYLDTFLMSCRALGRGVEQSFLSTIFDIANQKGLKMMLAPYNLGQRNGQVKTFLLKMGFNEKQSNVLEAKVANIPDKPKYIKILVQVPGLI